jgi:glycosyltransferase involved in cell wall biosynthesis
MKRRIVFGCLGPPGWGDANAWAYGLFERLREGPFDVTFVELLGEADAVFFRFLHGADFDNPRRLEKVLCCRIEEPGAREQPALGELLRRLAPDLIVAWGADAARLLRPAATEPPLVLVLADCGPIERLVEGELIRDWMGFHAAMERGVAFPIGVEDRELEAFDASDLVVPVSVLARAAFERLNPAVTGKIHSRPITPADLSYAEAEELAHLRRPFAERDVDVLFSAASWTRRAANLGLVKRVAAVLDGREVHVVGEIDEPVANARVHGALRHRRDLHALLGRTKAVVCPALAEAGPSVLFEAAAMGCNVVASPNCGHAALCNDALLAPSCSTDEIVERIQRALSRPYVESRDSFMGGVAELVEILAVF